MKMKQLMMAASAFQHPRRPLFEDLSFMKATRRPVNQSMKLSSILNNNLRIYLGKNMELTDQRRR